MASYRTGFRAEKSRFQMETAFVLYGSADGQELNTDW